MWVTGMVLTVNIVSVITMEQIVISFAMKLLITHAMDQETDNAEKITILESCVTHIENQLRVPTAAIKRQERRSVKERDLEKTVNSVFRTTTLRDSVMCTALR